jgi:nucleoside-diphosphate-sugar epimerase
MPPLPDADLDHVLEGTLPVWKRLRNGRLFITGGTGFFGTWLLESLTRAVDRLGIQTTALVLTRSPDAFARRSPHLAAHAAVRLHQGDVRDFTFPRGRFSHVIHAAFPSGLLPIDGRETVALVVQGTERTLDFAERSGAEQLLFVSSGAVYGPQPVDMAAIAESYRGAPDLCDPRAAYGESKRLAELLCCLAAARTGLAMKIARCFAFVGPHLPFDAHFAIGNFIRDALRGGPIHVQGDGTTVRSYLYAADLAVWLWTLLVFGEAGKACNIGSPEPVTMAELARLVASELAPQAVIRQNCLPRPMSVPNRYVPDVSHAAKTLGLSVRISLPEAIRRTGDWARFVPTVRDPVVAALNSHECSDVRPLPNGS